MVIAVSIFVSDLYGLFMLISIELVVCVSDSKIIVGDIVFSKPIKVALLK